MEISKDTLRKQHEYNRQSSSFNLVISIFFGLIFSLNNSGLNEKSSNIIVGVFLLILLYNNLKNNYVGDLYESRLVNLNTTIPYEKVLIKIKELDQDRPRKWFRVWKKSYFGFGFKNWWSNILGHLILIGLSLWLIFSPIFS